MGTTDPTALQVRVLAEEMRTKLANIVNVRDYGAIGDGSNNDTAAFRAAAAAVDTAGGGTIYAPRPPVEYRIGKIFVGPNTTLLIEPGTVLRRMGFTYGVINRYEDGSSPFADTSDPYSGHSNITIDGGIWVGSGTDYGPGFNVFQFVAARNITVRNLTVMDTATNHAIDINGIDGFTVSNCRFLGYIDTNGSRDYTEAIQYGPFSEDPAGYGEWVKHANGSPSRNIVVERCEFGPSGTPGTRSWPTGFGNHSAINDSRRGYTGNIHLHDNIFVGCTFIAITLYTYSHVKVDRNTFDGCVAGIRSTTFTLSKKWNTTTSAWETAPPRQTCYDHTITNNTFLNTGSYDIHLLGVTAGAGQSGFIEKAKILNNTRRIASGTRTTAQTMRLLLCNNVMVARNTCEYSTSGISIEACQGVICEGNEVSDTLGYGIIASNGGAAADYSRQIEIRNNVVRRAGSHAIGVSAVNTFTITGNSTYDHARIAGGTGVLFTDSKAGLISTNSVSCSSLPNAAEGIRGPNSTNSRVTLDNRISGVTTAVGNFDGAGTVYGNIQYT